MFLLRPQGLDRQHRHQEVLQVIQEVRQEALLVLGRQEGVQGRGQEEVQEGEDRERKKKTVTDSCCGQGVYNAQLLGHIFPSFLEMDIELVDFQY